MTPQMLMILLDSMERTPIVHDKVHHAVKVFGMCVMLGVIIYAVMAALKQNHKYNCYKYANDVYEKFYNKHSYIQKHNGEIPAVVKAMFNKFETIQDSGEAISLYDFKDFVSGLNEQDLTELEKFVGGVGLSRSNPGSRIALKAMRKRFKQINKETKQQLKRQAVR